MKVPMKKKIVLNYNDFGRINERLNHCFMYKFITCLIFHQYLRYFKSIKIFFLRINNFKINKKATRKMSNDVVLMLLLLTLEYFLSSDLFNICKKRRWFFHTESKQLFKVGYRPFPNCQYRLGNDLNSENI